MIYSDFLKEAADPKQIEWTNTRQDAMENLKKAFDAAGVKAENANVNGTALNIFNGVSKVHPIYTISCKQTSNGDRFIQIVDSSAEEMQSTGTITDLANPLITHNAKYNGSLPKYFTRNDKAYNKHLSNSKNDVTSQKSSYYMMPDGGIGAMGHKIGGSVTILSTINTVWSESKGEYLYATIGYDTKLQLSYVKTLTEINGTNVTVHKRPTEKQRTSNPEITSEWKKLLHEYRTGEELEFDESIELVKNYVINTIDSTTVNAAEKGGKLKYMITPIRILADELKRTQADVKTNVDEVTNQNVERPFVSFTPVVDGKAAKGLTIEVRSTKFTGYTEEKDVALITIANTSKTLLFLNAKANLAEINEPYYKDVITQFMHQVNADGLQTITSAVLAQVKQYVAEVADSLPIALSKQAKAEEFSDSANAQNKIDSLARRTAEENLIARTKFEQEMDAKLADEARERAAAERARNTELRRQYLANKRALLQQAKTKKASDITTDDFDSALAELGIAGGEWADDAKKI